MCVNILLNCTFQFVIKKLIPSPGWLVVSWYKQEVRTVTLVLFFFLLSVSYFTKHRGLPDLNTKSMLH